MDEDIKEPYGFAGPSTFPPRGKEGRRLDREPTTFPYKLYAALEDKAMQRYIMWYTEGDQHGFYIPNLDEFHKHVLPKHFKDIKQWPGSFLKQLSNYGFKKAARSVRDARWYHKLGNFRQGCPNLLPEVKKSGDQEPPHEHITQGPPGPGVYPVPWIIPPAFGQPPSYNWVQQMQWQMDSLKNELDLLKGRVNRLESRNEELKTWNEELKTRNEALEDAADQLRTTIRRLEEQQAPPPKSELKPSRAEVDTLTSGGGLPKLPMGGPASNLSTQSKPAHGSSLAGAWLHYPSDTSEPSTTTLPVGTNHKTTASQARHKGKGGPRHHIDPATVVWQAGEVQLPPVQFPKHHPFTGLDTGPSSSQETFRHDTPPSSVLSNGLSSAKDSILESWSLDPDPRNWICDLPSPNSYQATPTQPSTSQPVTSYHQTFTQTSQGTASRIKCRKTGVEVVGLPHPPGSN
ncbi:hypothetical protein FRB90_003642 [Tulasnella sp. 427]|nr:hypothetical protein FRB90_003642 [Tulasnella sp. 427]